MRYPWSENEGMSENFINPQYFRESVAEKSKYGGPFNFGQFEASYQFGTLRLLSLGINLMNWKLNSFSERAIQMFNNADGLEYSYKTDGTVNYNWGSSGINLDYQRSTRKKDENLTFSYRFSNSPEGNESFLYAKDIEGIMPLYIRLNQWYNNNAITTEHTGQIDYVNPITQKHSIETGLKYILRQNISNVKQYEQNGGGLWVELPTTGNNDFEHISNIYAGYAGYSFRSPKVGIRTGIRAEGTRQNVKFSLDKNRNFDVDYYNIVPSATISYQLKPAQQLRLGYNLRIYRPSIWYLNPYVDDTNPYNVSYGNPNLVPEKSNNFNLNYSFFSTKMTINVSTSYSYINNSIQSYTFINPDEPDVRQNTYGNIGRNQRAGLFVNAGWTPNQVFRINFNSGLNYADMKSDELNTSNSGLTGNVFVDTQITLPKDFRINASGQYMSGRVMLQGKQSGYYFANLGVNKDFMQRKLTVSLSYNNPFSRFLKMTASTSNEYFATNNTSFRPMREARISISYRFGNMSESIRKVQRSIVNDDVLDSGSGSSDRM